MDNTDAKQLLRAYRPGVDEPSREMAEALKLAEKDPALKEWFRGQQRFNGTLQGELRKVAVPADLKARILASQKTIVPWRKYFPKYAAAAALIGLLTLAMVWFPRNNEQKTFSGFQNRMVGFALREYRMDIVSNDADAIRQFLKTKGASTDYTLPAGINSLTPMGGARLSWQDRPVGMLCYKLENNATAYLFVLEESDLAEKTGLAAAPRFSSAKGLNTASWKRGTTIYFLAAPVSEGELKNLMGDVAAQYEYPAGASAMLVR